MNDILLSGLLNLFALFGAVNRTDKSRSLQMLSNYLTKHFGVRMLDDYLPLYSDLRDFYDISPELDKDAIIEGICSNIKHKISREDQTLMLLRLMEFCDPTPGSGKGESIAEENMQIFRKVAYSARWPSSSKWTETSLRTSYAMFPERPTHMCSPSPAMG